MDKFLNLRKSIYELLNEDIVNLIIRIKNYMQFWCKNYIHFEELYRYLIEFNYFIRRTEAMSATMKK
ncbi:hypothetical protein COK00_12725 [Bacillus cereus]|nr:hypothetical protein CN455_15055 [Bacillus cereus]PFB19636.1 hypothetical protein CN399_01110 [Bacillus cereus]PFP64832.1 hypothetical protein COK00_12725 [Bacillus cereus]PFV57631.1 hypothetical protein COL09_14860 [Bacillus cereus]